MVCKETLDKTGTVETVDHSNPNANFLGGEYEKHVTITTMEQQELKGIEDGLLEVHECVPGRKAEGTTRFI